MKWIKAKMEELNVTGNSNYKICFMVDDLAMITVHAPKYSSPSLRVRISAKQDRGPSNLRCSVVTMDTTQIQIMIALSS